MAQKRVAFLLHALSITMLSMQVTPSPVVPAIYIFGDSTVDVGNNNYLPNVSDDVKANHTPYGIDFPGSVPTGRFSNGYNTADYLAKQMLFDKSPPPYCELAKEGNLDEQMYKGINFASGGSGIQDSTGNIFGGVISLRKQIEYFSQIRNNMTAKNGSAATDTLLSKSLFLVSVGSNDIFEYAFFNGFTNCTKNGIFIAALTGLFKYHLSSLYQLGARKFGIISVSALGCCPSIRSQGGDGCSEDLNELVRKFYRDTSAILKELSYELPGMNYSLGNTFDMVENVFFNSLYFGFEELSSACCGGGKLNGQQPCTQKSSYCSNRTEYLFWDRYHPTQQSSLLAATTLYIGPPVFVTPVNISQLVLVNS